MLSPHSHSVAILGRICWPTSFMRHALRRVRTGRVAACRMGILASETHARHVLPFTTMGARTHEKLHKPPAHPHHACPHSLHWRTHARHLPATIRARTRFPLRSAPTWTHPTHPRATIMHWSTTMGARTHEMLRKPPAHPHHACHHSPHWQTHSRHVPATVLARTRFPLRSAPTWTHPTHPCATIMHWSTTMGARAHDKLGKPSAHAHHG